MSLFGENDVIVILNYVRHVLIRSLNYLTCYLQSLNRDAFIVHCRQFSLFSHYTG